MKQDVSWAGFSWELKAGPAYPVLTPTPTHTLPLSWRLWASGIPELANSVSSMSPHASPSKQLFLSWDPFHVPTLSQCICKDLSLDKNRAPGAGGFDHISVRGCSA